MLQQGAEQCREARLVQAGAGRLASLPEPLVGVAIREALLAWREARQGALSNSGRRTRNEVWEAMPARRAAFGRFTWRHDSRLGRA